MKLLCGKHFKRGVFAKGRVVFCLGHRSVISAFTLYLLFFIPANIVIGRSSAKLADPAIRQQIVDRLAGESEKRKAAAWAIAQKQGWVPKGEFNGVSFELMGIENNGVCIYRTCNVNAAISVASDLVRNTYPYDVNGAGLTVGIWDAGAVRSTHQEFVGRVTIRDGAANHDHSTHVGGTIGAAGVVAAALGMAPSIHIDSYEWTSDLSEMTSRAMSYPNEPNKIQVSNHSYGWACGWETGSWSGNYGPHWFGTWGYRESDYFGLYDSDTSNLDGICYNAPYYLPFRAAGNDRDDSAPSPGDRFWYINGGFWRSKKYNSSQDPYSDGWDNGGFDTILRGSAGKNVMTIGAVDDAVTGGVRDISKAAMASFSGWGPTDDGRIKPDIVTNGIGLYSSTAGSDSSYASYSGTSMATPGAAGSAMLLVNYYKKLFPSQAMRASTIKALILHTADDLGNPGPDYTFGWGLMNTKAAADQIKYHSIFPGINKIAEGELDDVNSTAAYHFKWDTTSPVRATLCWTDPCAPESTGLDNRSPRLINDLDLRIIDPNGLVYYPYVLDVNNPANTATTGDNRRDNVEQVFISSPAIPGSYTVQVSHKGTLANGQQYYSLILSGQSPADFDGSGIVDFNDLKVITDNWLTAEPSADIAPPGGDGNVDFLDFAEFAKFWY